MHDGAIILECTNTFDVGRQRSGIIRPLAPFALNELFVKRNIPSTVINYVNAWDKDTLVDTVLDWANKLGVQRPLILCSTLFGIYLLSKNSHVSDIVLKLKQSFTDSKLIIGGPINLVDYDFDQLLPDAVFQGRSLHLFEQWLDDPEYVEPGTVKVIKGIPTYHREANTVVENPIVPTLYDDYCLTANDIVQFEVRLGCKFNCTFCNFEFRNAKRVNDTSSACLANFFQTAYSKYAITRFSCVDDTFNEDNNKINTLVEAVSQLTFKPTIVGYNRFDIMMAKPAQAELLDRCGFIGHYFGIETLHREASKFIRKGIQREQALEFLRYLKTNFPHWHICSGYIVGLPKEPYQHVVETHRMIRDQRLIDAIIPEDLGIYRIPGNEHNYSDFGKDPESYGIKILDGGNPNSLNWEHNHMDKRTAKVLAKTLAAKNIKGGVTTIDPWEAICRDTLGTEDVFGNKTYKERMAADPSLLYSPEWYALSDNFVAQYIQRKISYVKNL